MFRTVNSVGMLQAIAIVVGLAIIFWSIGLPSLRLVEAANVTNVSDTLSDSAPSAPSNHSISYVATSGVANTEDIVLTFPGSFNLTGIAEEDIDLLIDGGNKPAAEWSVVNGGSTLTISIDTGSIGSGSTTLILIGDHATNEGSPDTQITNPGSEGSYTIDIASGSLDSGSAMVAIIDSVLVSAAVDTIFSFAVSGLPSGTSVNGDTTTGQTTTTTIPFGTLSNGVATTSAQRLAVTTNATNGYVVTVQVDGDLESTTGAIIDSFIDGSATNTPTTWAVPSATLGSLNTYGHWGITSDDTDTTRAPADEFGSQEYIGASTTPRVVMSHNGPANATGAGVGTTTVGYKVEISALQEAADDYTAVLTYVATPTF